MHLLTTLIPYFIFCIADDALSFYELELKSTFYILCKCERQVYFKVILKVG